MHSNPSSQSFLAENLNTKTPTVKHNTYNIIIAHIFYFFFRKPKQNLDMISETCEWKITKLQTWDDRLSLT